MIRLALAAAVLAIAGCRTTHEFDAARRGGLARDVIARWAAPSRLAADKMLAEYGPPDAFAEDGLGWTKCGAFKRIIVRDSVEALRHTVAYRVPAAKRGALDELGLGVSASAEGDELTARSLDEKYAILALNLADEVARGVRSPDDARRFYARAVTLEASGKSELLMKRILFPTPD